MKKYLSVLLVMFVVCLSAGQAEALNCSPAACQGANQALCRRADQVLSTLAMIDRKQGRQAVIDAINQNDKYRQASQDFYVFFVETKPKQLMLANGGNTALSGQSLVAVQQRLFPHCQGQYYCEVPQFAVDIQQLAKQGCHQFFLSWRDKKTNRVERMVNVLSRYQFCTVGQQCYLGVNFRDQR